MIQDKYTKIAVSVLNYVNSSYNQSDIFDAYNKWVQSAKNCNNLLQSKQDIQYALNCFDANINYNSKRQLNELILLNKTAN